MVPWVGWAFAALAQEEPCVGAYSLTEWRANLDAATEALAHVDHERADALLEGVRADVRCLEAPVPPELLRRHARLAAVVGFFQQDPEVAASWARLAQDAPLPQSIPVPPSYSTFISELVAAPVAPEIDVGWNPPKGGLILIDGQWYPVPTAGFDRPHLVQAIDKKKRVTLTEWQDGRAFPAALLGPPRAQVAPKWWTGPATEPDASPKVSPAAASCPWTGQPRQIKLTKAKASIEGTVFLLKTDAQRRAFSDTLRTCGELRAIKRFKRWRYAIKRAPFRAPAYKQSLVRALVGPEPKPKRQKAQR